MRQLVISNKKVNLPQSWDELSQEQYVYIAGLLWKYMAGELDLIKLQIFATLKILNMQVTPTKRDVISLSNYLAYLFEMFRMRISRIIRPVRKEDFIKFRQAAREYYLYRPPREDLLTYNVIQISKELTFLSDSMLDIVFTRNPIPVIKPVGQGKRFDIGLIISTDITAGTYADLMDLVVAWENSKQELLLDYMVLLLYSNLTMKEAAQNKPILDKVKALDFDLKFAIYLWFVSITCYFAKHPVYHHLYIGKKSESEKVSIGASESIIRLSKSGYGNIEMIRSKSVVDFFDIQFAELQESIRSAVSSGIEISKIAEKTGRTLSQIDQLS